MSTMIEDRGAEFAAGWPAGTARRIGLSPEYAAIALKDLGIIGAEREYAVRSACLSGELVEEIGTLTSEQTKAVIARMREIKREIVESRKTNCYYCGVSLVDGECPSCGEQD